MKGITKTCSGIAIVVLLSIGICHAADVGVRITSKVPAHGHSGPLDGGVLRNTYTVLTTTNSVVVTANTSTIIRWDTETIDTLGTHSTTTNPSRVTVPVTSYSLAVAQCSFMVSKTASELTIDTVGVYKNGSLAASTTYQWPSVALLGVATVLSNESYISVAAGDYLECGYTNGDPTNSVTLQQNRFSVQLYR